MGVWEKNMVYSALIAFSSISNNRMKKSSLHLWLDSILVLFCGCGLQSVGTSCEMQHYYWRKIHGNK